MDDSEATSLEQIRAFLAGSGEVRFAGQRREEVYGWVEQTLVRHQYASLDRPGKGLVRRYIARMTGLSRAQVTRLITGYRQHRPGESGGLSADPVRHTLHRGRCEPAGLRRQGAWELERTGDPANPGARIRRIRPGGLPAVVGDFGGASLPAAQLGSLPETQHQLPAHAAHAHSHRRAAQAAAARLARIPAHRHGASGRSGGTQGAVSHQRRGRSDAVGDCGRHAANLTNSGCCRCWKPCSGSFRS